MVIVYFANCLYHYSALYSLVLELCMEEANAEKKVGLDVNDHLPELHESTEPERKKKSGRCNLRKSLAWDSAFFTSAGILCIGSVLILIEKPLFWI